MTNGMGTNQNLSYKMRYMKFPWTLDTLDTNALPNTGQKTRTDLVLLNEKRTSYLVDFAIPEDYIVKIKSEKQNKYLGSHLRVVEHKGDSDIFYFKKL